VFFLETRLEKVGERNSAWKSGSQRKAVKGKSEELDVEKCGGLVTMVTEEGLKDTSPSPVRGLSLFNRNMFISFVLIHYSVKERRY
jgi:hypothetical protein